MHEVCLNCLGQKICIFPRSFIHMLARVSESILIISNYEAAVRPVQNKTRKCGGRESAQQRTRVAEQTWHRKIYFLLLVKTFNFGLSRSHNYAYTKPARHFRGPLQTNSWESYHGIKLRQYGITGSIWLKNTIWLQTDWTSVFLIPIAVRYI